MTRLTCRTMLLLAGVTTPFASQALNASREDLASFLGTSVVALEGINPGAGQTTPDGRNRDVTRGVAMRRQLTLQAGDTLSFDWFFATNEGTTGANNEVYDFSFFTVDGALRFLASGADPLEPASNSPFFDQLQPLNGTYFRTQTISFASAGDHVLGFGIVDTVDTVVESGLVLDNVRLNGELIDNGGFEDSSDDGVTTTFTGWEALGVVSPWSNQPFAPEGNVGAALISGGYESTPVPIPAAAWMLGSAVGVLGWRRRLST